MWEPGAKQAFQSQDKRLVKELRFLVGSADLKQEFSVDLVSGLTGIVAAAHFR
jgi:hypothetical protein